MTDAPTPVVLDEDQGSLRASPFVPTEPLNDPWAELERLAKICATVDPIGPGWYTYADLSRHMEPCDARMVERLTPATVLKLIEAARQGGRK